MKKLMLSAAILAAATLSANTNAAGAKVEASVSASNFYLWRGLNLGKTTIERADGTNSSVFGGEPQIAGDLNVSGDSGLYAGTWVSSGDAELGTEIDLYFGYGGEVGDFSYDLSYWSYLYPEGKTDFGESAEVILGLGYGAIDYAYYHNVSRPTQEDVDRKWNYMTLGADLGALSKSLEKFSLLVGKHNKQSANGLLHTDLSYAYNDNLSFTLSVPLDVDGDNDKGRPLLNAALTLPLSF